VDFLSFIIGFASGVLIAFFIGYIFQRQKIQERESLIKSFKDTFVLLSREVLLQNSDDFLKLAKEVLSTQTLDGKRELETKKQLIDNTLIDIKAELEKVNELVNKLEKDRENKFGKITELMENAVDQTGKLQKITNQLNAVLSNQAARGQWGERMAEDIINLVGLKENINYLKQKTSKVTGTRPDFTFLLPKDLKVNMDVKFPLNSYIRYINAEADSDKSKFKLAFLRDVRSRINEVIASREYINLEEKTIDYVIVFIPNEQVYNFVNENDRGLIDYALKNKVILCSPITLYAVLSVIRQAVDNFMLERRSKEILTLLQEFDKRWDNFAKSLLEMGKILGEAQKEYNNLTVKCQYQLESCLKKIYGLRQNSTIDQELYSNEKMNDDNF